MQTQSLKLGRTLKQVQYRNHRALDSALAPIGISLVQWDALRAIEQMPNASAHALAQATFQTDQAFSTLAARLEQRGWIRRQPGVGRALIHELTTTGSTVLEHGQPLAQTVLDRAFAQLSEGERASLLRLLNRVMKAQEQVDG